MDFDIFDITKYTWHSPRYILICFDRILAAFGEVVYSHGEFKKVREIKAVAILLLGLYKLQNIPYLLQISRDTSPDVITLRLREAKDISVEAQRQTVEVVTYGHFSDKGILEFLINTKLSPEKAKKSYDDKTVILCEITKQIRLPPYKLMFEELKKINPRPVVFTLGKISQDKHIYQICQIWPEIDFLTDIDMIELANSYPKPHNTRFIKSASKKVTIAPSVLPKPNEFEVFGLDKAKLYKKFKE